VDYLSTFYISGVIIFTLLFIFKFSKLIQLIKNNKIVHDKKSKFVMVVNERVAFSFFNYIFIGTAIKKEKRQNVIEHELIHSKEKHSLDLLIFEFLKIVLWFNPIVYLFQKRITINHEYIADREILKRNSKEDYLNAILSEAFQVEGLSFTNQYYLKSLIKKRIAMMTKRKSKQWKQLKYLSILPIVFFAILYTSCAEEKTTENNQGFDTEDSQPVSVAYTDGLGHKTYTGKNLDEVLEKHIRPYLTNNTELKIKQFDKKENKDTVHVFIMALDKTTKKLIHAKNKEQKPFVYEEGKPVPFQELSKGPYFANSTCERGTKECFSSDISTHIDDNFDVSTTKNLGLTPGKMRVFVMFTITENGSLTNIKCRAPHPNLVEEAKRVVKLIPKINPGIYKDKKVITRYSLPISFTIE
jgi:hypothetical protein